jgi:uncharacterized OB-fold protein
MLKHCAGCGAFLPAHRLVCPVCHSAELAPCQASGQGKIHAGTAVSKSRDSAEMVWMAMVDLDEGPRVIGRLVGSDSRPANGAAVVTEFEPVGDDLAVPVFRLRSDATE